MKAWNDMELNGLNWAQSGALSRHYELRNDNGDVLGTLRRRRWWSSYTEVEAPGNRWSFERRGLFRRHIVIQSIGTGDEPARFDYRGVSEGTLTFPDGRTFDWRRSNFWGTKWAWIDPEADTPFLGFQSGGLLRLNGELRIDPGAEDMPLLAMLIFLGWYLVTLHYEDSSSSVVAVTV